MAVVLLLAIGGIGGTALDQRQQYSACQSFKKVPPAPAYAACATFNPGFQELDEFRSVVAAYIPSPPRPGA